MLLCLIRGRADRRWRPGAAGGSASGYYLVGLYWITEAILIEAARFWWLVPLAVPALAAVLAVFVAIPAAVTWLGQAGLADGYAGRRLGAGGSRAPVYRHRLSLEPAGQRLGSSRAGSATS